MELESYLQKKLKEKDILLMTHIVLGYPSFKESFQIIEEMVAAGVDIMELQIPFSEPIADGPVILRANQKALENGATVQDCLAMAQKAAETFDIPFLIMTYYNILYKYGVPEFTAKMASSSIAGAIIPDLPPEEGSAYLTFMEKSKLAPIIIFSPTTTSDRMQYLADFAKGFIYCIARKGVTGEKTTFSNKLSDYLSGCHNVTSLPIAVGFGIKDRQDIQFLKGKAEIAVIGSQTIRIMEQDGITAVGNFILSLQ